MSLIETNVFEVAKKQYFFKLKANFGLFFTLAMIQMIGISFSTIGVVPAGIYYMEVTSMPSGNIVILATVIWAMSTSFILTGRNYTNMDFTFVSNRLSSNLSNLGILLTSAIVGSITACLSGVFLRAFSWYILDNKHPVAESFIIQPQNLLISIIGLMFYLILVMSIGYLIGIFVQPGKIVGFILAFIAVEIVMTLNMFLASFQLLKQIIDFYFMENSLLLFSVKTTIPAIIFFTGAIFLSNRFEVKR